MEEKNHVSQTLCEKSKSASSQVRHFPAEVKRAMSFSVLLETVKVQTDYDCFDEADAQQAEEIAMIIAEVLKLPDTATVRIGGSALPAEWVAEIYDRICHEHVLHVIENYEKVTYEIKHTKTYLRTALYNAVFELTSRTSNRIFTDMPQLARK